MNALEIFYKRRKLGTMSRDYGKTIDDVLHIEDSKELDIIESALTELEEIKKRAEEKIMQVKIIKGKTYIVLAMLADEIVNLIDFIIKGEGK